MPAPITSRDTTMRMLRKEVSGSLWLNRYALLIACQKLDLVQLNEVLDQVVEEAAEYRSGSERVFELNRERFPNRP